MNTPPLSTLAARFVENLHPARRILHAFPSFYMRRLFAAPVLPKLCGGMGTAQIQSARFYKGNVDNNGAITEADLSFTGFPTVGSVTTYDSTSFCPDSASTATSIATGHNNHEVAAQAGYNVVTTQAGAAALAAGAGKTLIIAENLADGKAMNYALDAQPGEWQLSDYVKKGIELLDNDKGFFLMTESGKIDWACHANDAAASIHDVLEMSNAVQAAVDFYNAHPNDTLILVTADHETGGMAIGYKTTNYDTFLTNLTHQKMSYAKFDSTYVKGYIANKTPFEAAMADVKANFGLTLPTDPDAASAGKLLLTDYEVENLRKAYERTLEVGASSQKEMSQQDYELYGTYIPFSMAICHTINHKSGMDHTTYAHTGAMVNIYANGVGAENFGGLFDNTEIYHKLADLTKVQ